jgi:transcriptional regulator with XRE-family HTH domain
MKDRIKKIRTDAGLSQSDFAKKLSISRSAICKLEYGENQPSEQTFKKLFL